MSGDRSLVILTINAGSSSIKFAVYRRLNSKSRLDLILAGKLERIAVGGGRFVAHDDRQAVLVERQVELPNYEAALKAMMDWLKSTPYGQEVRMVGHRVVQGA